MRRRDNASCHVDQIHGIGCIHDHGSPLGIRNAVVDQNSVLNLSNRRVNNVVPDEGPCETQVATRCARLIERHIDNGFGRNDLQRARSTDENVCSRLDLCQRGVRHHVNVDRRTRTGLRPLGSRRDDEVLEPRLDGQFQVERSDDRDLIQG